MEGRRKGLKLKGLKGLVRSVKNCIITFFWCLGKNSKNIRELYMTMPCFLPKQQGSNKVVMVNTENQKPTTNYLPIANHCNINTSSSVHLKLKGLMLKSKDLNVTGSKIEGSQTPGVPTKKYHSHDNDTFRVLKSAKRRDDSEKRIKENGLCRCLALSNDEQDSRWDSI